MRGVSNVAVSKAVRAGRITLVRGKIDPKRADREWEENTDQSKPSNSVTGKPQTANPRRSHRGVSPSKPMDLDEPDSPRRGNGSGEGYARARALREAYDARLRKLELDRQMGKIVDVEEVQLGVFNMTRKFRDEILAVPARISVILAAIQDPAELERILEEELERICQELADGKWH
jgi:hypothetical protein